MGVIKIYPPVKLFVAVTISDKTLWPSLIQKLEELYSKTDYQIDWYQFSHTKFYEEEMGENLSKRMVSFAELMTAERLPDIKMATNEIETEFSEQSKRRINVDPGYLNASKIVLATTKDYGHRVYLGRGIFGDVHLRFVNHRFQTTEWTYPDYKERFVLEFFEEVRRKYMSQLANYEY